MRTAICDFEEVQGKEAWEARKCNFVENPYCNCKECDCMMGFKKTKLINGEKVILVDCSYSGSDNMFLEERVKYYLDMSLKAIENEDSEGFYKYSKNLINAKKLLIKIKQE